MKRKLIAVLFLITALLAACAPGVTPTPAAPTATPPPTKAPSAAAPAATAQQSDWDKVVQAAQKEGAINIYTWGWTGDTGTAIARAFENRFGIKVNLVTGRGAEFIERIKTETRMGQVTADVFEGAASHSENMRLAGLLVPPGNLPVLQNKSGFAADPFGFSPEGYYLKENQFYLALYVNTNLVKPGDEPKAWADLLDPKWKGKVAFSDPEVSVSTSYFAVLLQQNLLAPDFMQKLGKQSLVFDPSTNGVANKIVTGEVYAGYSDNNAVSPLALQGGPIKIVDTKEGVFSDGLAIGMVKNGPHPNATKVFLNWMLDKEGQDVYSKAKGVLTIRTDVPDYQPKGVQLKPQNPIFINAAYNDLIAKTFAAKQFVPLLKPK